MKIDDAINMLIEDKKAGTKSVLLAYWLADKFGMQDDERWQGLCSTVEESMDWSPTHKAMVELMEPPPPPSCRCH